MNVLCVFKYPLFFFFFFYWLLLENISGIFIDCCSDVYADEREIENNISNLPFHVYTSLQLLPRYLFVISSACAMKSLMATLSHSRLYNQYMTSH